MQYKLGETKIIINETFCQAEKQEEINQRTAKNIYERILRWVWAEEKTNLSETEQDSKNKEN